MMKSALFVVALMTCAVGCTNTTTGTDSSKQAGTGDQQNPDGTPNNGAGTGTGTTTGGEGKANSPQQEAAINANTVYTAEADQAKANEIVTRMWTTLTSHKCWYLHGTSNNYSFSGYNDYRYAGTVDTYAGQIGLNSAGKYGGYDAADILINGEQQYIGIYDDHTMAIAKRYFDGSWMINWYDADDRLCV